MKYYYIVAEQQSNQVAEEGIKCDKNGMIDLVALKDTFLMDKFVLDVYAYEVLGLEEYCLFEIALSAISGQVVENDINNLFVDFFKILIQPAVEPEHLKRITTDRYEGMGLDVGIHLVENKEKFTSAYKKKVLSYYRELG